jgi:hypothetical protein
MASSNFSNHCKALRARCSFGGPVLCTLLAIPQHQTSSRAATNFNLWSWDVRSDKNLTPTYSSRSYSMAVWGHQSMKHDMLPAHNLSGDSLPPTVYWPDISFTRKELQIPTRAEYKIMLSLTKFWKGWAQWRLLFKSLTTSLLNS